MRRLAERGSALAEQARRKLTEDCSSIIVDALPHAEIEVAHDQIIVTGRRLVRRWLERAELRFLGRQGP